MNNGRPCMATLVFMDPGFRRGASIFSKALSQRSRKITFWSPNHHVPVDELSPLTCDECVSRTVRSRFMPWVIAAGAALGTFLLIRWIDLVRPYDPTFSAAFTPHGILLQGFGWPPKSRVRLSVWNEPYEESGEIYNAPPRVLGEIKVNDKSYFEHTIPFPTNKVRGERPPYFRDVFFLAYHRRRRTIRLASMWNGSALWFH